MNIGITGAGGFVGRRFIEYNRNRYSITRIPLRLTKPAELELPRVHAIIHLAGKAHDMKAADDRAYWEVNYELTRSLANEAKKRGIPHFVYISSVKVYGHEADMVFSEDSACHPVDPYGKSKLEAESYLKSIQTDNFKVAIIRPPLIYGPGVKGNMLRLLKLAEKNLPLPFGGTANQRSMVFLDNLVELINRIIEIGASGTFVAGDLHTISTGELMHLIRSSMNKKDGLITISPFTRILLKIFRPSLFNRLYGSFVIDNSKTNLALDFIPPYPTEYGIKQMVDWYIVHKKEGNPPMVIK